MAIYWSHQIACSSMDNDIFCAFLLQDYYLYFYHIYCVLSFPTYILFTVTNLHCHRIAYYCTCLSQPSSHSSKSFTHPTPVLDDRCQHICSRRFASIHICSFLGRMGIEIFVYSHTFLHFYPCISLSCVLFASQSLSLFFSLIFFGFL